MSPSRYSEREPSATLLVTGTDPSQSKGGVSFAVASFLDACRAAGIAEDALKIVPTYRVGSIGDRYGMWLSTLMRMPKLLRVVPKPLVWSHAGAGMSLLRECLLIAFARALGAVTVLHLHAGEVDGYLDSTIGRQLMRLCLRVPHGIAVLSDYWQSRLESTTQRHAFVVPNAVPDWHARTSEQSGGSEGQDPKRVVTMSRLTAGKGVDRVIRTLTRLPDAYGLDVIGHGPQLSSLLDLSKELRLEDRIVFHGWLTGHKKTEVLERGSVFFLPTQHDSFGIVFLEAIQHGLPVVCCDHQPVKSALAGCPTATFLNHQFEPDEAASVIRSICELDRQPGAPQLARSWLQDLYSPENVGARVLQVISTLQKPRLKTLPPKSQM